MIELDWTTLLAAMVTTAAGIIGAWFTMRSQIEKTRRDDRRASNMAQEEAEVAFWARVVEMGNDVQGRLDRLAAEYDTIRAEYLAMQAEVITLRAAQERNARELVYYRRGVARLVAQLTAAGLEPVWVPQENGVI